MARSLKSKKSDNTGLPPRVARAIAKYEKLIPQIERMASFPVLNPNPVFEIDFLGKLTFFNKASVDTLEKIGAGKNIRTFFPPDIKAILKKTRSNRKLQLVRRVGIKDKIFEASIHIVPKFKAIRFFLKDVTDRERFESSLRESEERYQGLFQGLPLSTVVFQRAGKDFVVKEFNRASNAITGGKMPEYLGLSAKKLYRSRPDILRKFAVVWKKKNTQILQSAYRMLSTGRQIYLQLTLTFIPPDKILVHTEDLSERKQVEEDLRETKGRLEIRVKERTAELERIRVALEQTNAYHRNLIEVSLDPLVTISAAGKITDVNKATIKATGRSRRELVGTDFSSYFTEPEKARAGYQKAFQEGTVQNYELVIKHRNGHLTPVLYNASLFYNEAGKAAGIFAATRDITVLKNTEADLREHRDQLEELIKERSKDLREREDQLRHAQEIANLGGWELNLTSNRLSWSDEVYRIFGLKPQEFKATYEAFLECVHPDDRAAVDGAYTGSLQEGRDTYEIEHRIVRKDTGEIRTVLEKCAHFRDPAGRVVRSIGMVQDITLRKRTENELLALNLRLEEINRHLNDFVFTVSHDLKAPLRAIQGYADALLEDQAQKLDPDGRANIERIAIASQRLDEMIQDLLAYSRISSEQITMEPVDLKTLVREVIDRLPPEAVVKNAVFSVDPGLPAVIAHRPIIEQVLDNLVLNAVTYVKPGIRPEIKIWVEDHSSWTYLFVKDNGIGIAVENQERIFKVFERLHGVESYPGTGVGLAIVKKGVERLGGRFGVISKLSEGSTFWIALPREIVAKI